jgi:hypothetical protein
LEGLGAFGETDAAVKSQKLAPFPEHDINEAGAPAGLVYFSIPFTAACSIHCPKILFSRDNPSVLEALAKVLSKDNFLRSRDFLMKCRK